MAGQLTSDRPVHRFAWAIIAVILSVPSGLGLFPMPQNTSAPARGTTQIRVKTELIQVRAVVTNSKGNLVDNLSKEDFLLIEDGRPQSISFFSVERIPPRGATKAAKASEPAKPGVIAPAPTPPSRSVAVVVDTVHATHISLWNVKKAVMEFINEHITDQDWVALITTSRSLGVFEQFTQDRDVLRAAVQQIRPWRMREEQQLFTPALASRIIQRDPEASCIGDQLLPNMIYGLSFVAKGIDCHKITNYRPSSYLLARCNVLLLETAFARRAVTSVLSNVAERMAELPGQRFIAFFSDGFSMAGTAGEMGFGDLQPVLGKAAGSGVILYTFDSKGLQPLMLSAAADSYRPSQFSLTDVSQLLSEENLDNRHTLGTLAGETGGEAALGTNDLGGAMRRMLEANSICYELAYYPPAGGDAAKFRTIKVTVKDHPEYHVRAQRGYSLADIRRSDVAEQAPRDKLRAALQRFIPARELEVTAIAEPLPSAKSESQVMLNLRVRGEILRSGEQGGRVLPDLRLECAIFNRAGKQVDTFKSKMAELMVPPGREIPARFDIPYGGPIPVSPGIYHIRIGIEDTRSGRVGTAHAWVDVPDLRNGHMALGHIVVGSAANGKAIQTFGPGDRVMYQFRIYKAAAKDSEKDLTMQLQVFHGEDRVRSEEWQPVAPHIKSHDDAGWIVSGELEPTGLPTGVLQLRVTAKSAHPNQTDHRDAYFELRP